MRLTLTRVGNLTSRELATIVHGLAKSRVVVQGTYALFEAVARAASDDLRSFNPQDLSMVVWSFAKAGVGADALFEAVARAASSSDLRSFNPQGLANMIWSFAKAGVRADALFEAVARAASSSDLRGFNPQGLGMIMFAFAKMGVHTGPCAIALFQAMAKVSHPYWSIDLLANVAGEELVAAEIQVAAETPTAQPVTAAHHNLEALKHLMVVVRSMQIDGYALQVEAARALSARTTSVTLGWSQPRGTERNTYAASPTSAATTASTTSSTSATLSISTFTTNKIATTPPQPPVRHAANHGSLRSPATSAINFDCITPFASPTSSFTHGPDSSPAAFQTELKKKV